MHGWELPALYSVRSFSMHFLFVPFHDWHETWRLGLFWFKDGDFSEDFFDSVALCEARTDILKKKCGLIPVFWDKAFVFWGNLYHQQTFTMRANYWMYDLGNNAIHTIVLVRSVIDFFSCSGSSLHVNERK